MKRKEWLLGIAVLACLVAVAWFLWPRPGVYCADLEEARTVIEAEGFFCTSDRVDGKICTGFLVTRAATTADDVNLLCKVGPMGQDWKGKVWVQIHKPTQTWMIPETADARVWGGVHVFGDKSFLEQLEAALQRGRASSM